MENVKITKAEYKEIKTKDFSKEEIEKLQQLTNSL